MPIQLPVEDALREAATFFNRSMHIACHTYEDNRGKHHNFQIDYSGTSSNCLRLRELLGGNAHLKKGPKSHDHWAMSRRADIEKLMPVLLPFLNEERRVEAEREMKTWPQSKAMRGQDRGIAMLGGKPVRYVRARRS